jgi:hypothetical protein
MKVHLSCLGVRIVCTHEPIKIFFVVRKIDIENVGVDRCEVLTAALEVALPECGTLSVPK